MPSIATSSVPAAHTLPAIGRPPHGIVSLSGSPSLVSRSGALLDLLEARLAARLGAPPRCTRVAVRALPAEALLHARTADAQIAAAVAAVRDARLVLVATPIYKAAYSGLLKTFLDLLPQDALRGKTVVPLATGGSAGHLLALDYALKPVLGALGARDIRDAVFASDAQLPSQADGYSAVPELAERLERIAADLLGDWPALALRASLSLPVVGASDPALERQAA